MVDQMMQAYHWSYEESLERTMAQIVLLNHASHVNSKRLDIRMKATQKKIEKERDTTTKREKEDPVIYKGKRLTELSSDELDDYYGDL